MIMIFGILAVAAIMCYFYTLERNNRLSWMFGCLVLIFGLLFTWSLLTTTKYISQTETCLIYWWNNKCIFN